MNERVKMIGDYLSASESISQLARRFGVSRKTVYKWIERYELFGPAGLEDLSRVPHHCPHALSEAEERRILEWKAQKPLWGALQVEGRVGSMSIGEHGEQRIGSTWVDPQAASAWQSHSERKSFGRMYGGQSSVVCGFQRAF